MDYLRQFNADEATKGELLDYLHEFIAEEALKKMYAREDTSHIADARELVDKAFDNLEQIYAIPKSEEPPTNEAR